MSDNKERAMSTEQLEQERAEFEAAWEAHLMPAESDWFRRDPLDEDDYDFALTSHAWAAWQLRAQQQAASGVADEVYCALQYVEGSLAAIANREELVGDTISRTDSIGAASKRAKAALGRLQAVAHLIASAPTPTVPADVMADAAQALRHAAKVIELYDDATMRADHMIDSGECAGILNALAEYHARAAEKGTTTSAYSDEPDWPTQAR